MKRLCLCLSILIATGLTYGKVTAQADSNVFPLVITEVKVKNTSSSLPDEFIEFYNNSDEPILLQEYYLEYFNVHSPSPGMIPTKAAFSLPETEIGPYQLVVLAINPEHVPGSLDLSLQSLKDSEGQLNLYYQSDTSETGKLLAQSVSWGDPPSVLSGVIKPPSVPSYSIQRYAESTDTPVVFSENWKTDTSTPGNLLIVVPPPEEPEEPEQPAPPVESPDSPEEIPEETVAPLPKELMPLRITELLPNPMAPQSDTLDEYVEIFNPNDEAMDLSGYVIQTGNSYSYSHNLDGITIGPLSYLVITSGSTDIALANTSSKSRLISSEGQIISETPEYTNAPEGQAWALFGTAWSWTSTPTSAAENISSTPPPKQVAVKATSKAPVKKTATKKPAAVKASTTKAASSKTASVSAERDVYEDPEEINVAPMHPMIVAGVGILAVGYAGYEYRQDIANRIFQLRRYREHRRALRTKS